MNEEKLIVRFERIYNSILSGKKEKHLVNLCHTLINAVIGTPFEGFHFKMRYFMCVKTHEIIAKYNEPKNVFEDEGHRVFRIINDTTLRDRTLDDRKKLAIQMILNGSLVKRILKIKE